MDATIMPNVASPIAQLTIKAAKRNGVNAYFWLGINDVQVFRDSLITWNSEMSRYDINTTFANKLISRYKDIIGFYIDNHKNKDDFKTNKINKIYIISIESTSTNDKNYYDMQGDVIDYLNTQLAYWAYQEYQNGNYDSEEECWLQFVYLDGKTTNHHTQTFVKNTDFSDNFHFKESWYI